MSGDVLAMEAPGGTNAEAEAFFSHEGGAAVLDTVATASGLWGVGRTSRLAACNRDGRGHGIYNRDGCSHGFSKRDACCYTMPIQGVGEFLGGIGVGALEVIDGSCGDGEMSGAGTSVFEVPGVIAATECPTGDDHGARDAGGHEFCIDRGQGGDASAPGIARLFVSARTLLGIFELHLHRLRVNPCGKPTAWVLG